VAVPLTRRALNRALLARQILLARETAGVEEVIARLAGMQAQEPRPPFTGLWSRIEGFRREALLDALRERRVVRATLMRGTLHLMTAEDYASLRGALQPGLDLGGMAILGERAAGIDPAAVAAAAAPLFRERPRTFTEVRDALSRAFPGVADERAMGYIARTRLPLVVAPDEAAEWGFRPDPAFTDAEAWLGRPVSADPAPDALVLRYLAAFGPATPADFQAWSGLKGAKAAFVQLADRLAVLTDERGRTLYDLPDAPRPPEDAPAPARLVADFDNLILSHADRTRIIADEHRPLVVSRNLRVAPTFLVDGFVAGTWKLAATRKAATVTLSPFAALPAAAREELAAEAGALARFLAPGAADARVEFAG